MHYAIRARGIQTCARDAASSIADYATRRASAVLHAAADLAILRAIRDVTVVAPGDDWESLHPEAD